MSRIFSATKVNVKNRGAAPDSFLNELIDWAIKADDLIFTENGNADIYVKVKPQLGPWKNLKHRKAVMLEVLRVLGGFESSWDWHAGIDTTNPSSNTDCTEEAGIFQCSGNSMNFNVSLKDLLVSNTGKSDCITFKAETKKNHLFAIEYCARLLRFTTNHHGPIKNNHINEYITKEAVAEFEHYLL